MLDGTLMLVTTVGGLRAFHDGGTGDVASIWPRPQVCGYAFDPAAPVTGIARWP
jgi:hypothetical protein